LKGTESGQTDVEPSPSTISVFPNPCATTLNITAGNGTANNAILKTMLGETVLAVDAIPGNATINLSALPSGNYILSIFNGINSYHQVIVKY